MAVKVLALASGVTGLADHRQLEGSLLTKDGATATRSGMLQGASNGSLSTVSAMVARVGPLSCVIANSISSTLGPYIVVSDANVDITFADGEASVSRVDRIIVRVRDNTNDGSGSTAGSVEYLKGQASGAATAMPNNSLLLFEMTVPAGTSAGGGGLNFANAVDQKVWTSAVGGITRVANSTVQSAISNPYDGMATYRQDLDALYIYNGSTWEPRGQITVSSSANLSTITNPYNGLIAVARDTGYIYIYDGSTWQLRAGNAVRLFDQRTSDSSSISTTTLTSVLQVTLPRTGTYSFDLLAPFSNTAATGRIAFALGGTSTTNAWRWASGVSAYNSATGLQGSNGAGTTYPASTSGTALINSDLANSSGYCFVQIKGTVTVTATGTLQFRFANVSGSNAIGVKAGSMVNVDYLV